MIVTPVWTSSAATQPGEYIHFHPAVGLPCLLAGWQSDAWSLDLCSSAGCDDLIVAFA